MTAYMLDMDGVLHHGDRVLPGAPDFVHRVPGSKHLFITYNPILPLPQVARRLSSLLTTEFEAAGIFQAAS